MPVGTTDYRERLRGPGTQDVLAMILRGLARPQTEDPVLDAEGAAAVRQLGTPLRPDQQAAQADRMARDVHRRIIGAPPSKPQQEGGTSGFMSWLERGGIGGSLGMQSVAQQAAEHERLYEQRRAGGVAPAPSDMAVAESGMGVAGNFDFTGAIKAYHGSPHTFDRFDMSKIGTGEGAQAYGHGLYFAENPEVAKNYSKMFNPQIVADNNKRMVELAREMSKLEKPGRYREYTDPKGYELANEYDRLMEQKLNRDNGSIYHANLDVEHSDLLDWDKPLSEQPAKVREALAGVGITGVEDAPKLGKLRSKLADLQAQADRASNSDPVFRQMDRVKRQIAAVGGASGKDIYWSLGDGPSSAQALRAAGIPGIRYLDAGSRGAGEGSYNVVLFDESLAQILERNGQAVAAAADRKAREAYQRIVGY